MIGHTPYSLNLDTPMEHSEFFTRNESNELRALTPCEYKKSSYNHIAKQVKSVSLWNK
jgi:hypothetical protein